MTTTTTTTTTATATAIDLEPTTGRPECTSTRRTPIASIVRNLAALLVVVGLFGVLGASPASADTYVAGHQFGTSSARCLPGQLSVYVAGNPNDYSTNRYFQIVLWDYARAEWVYGGWHAMSSYGITASNDFVFNHHGQYYPEVHYAVLTSAGWYHGWETFPRFNQTNNIGQNYTSSTCVI